MKLKVISKENLKLLINLKSLYLHGSSHADGKTITDRMIAILNFDNCIEWMLKILVKHFDVQEISKVDPTTTLAGKIHNFLLENNLGKLPFKHQIENLHAIRNMIQHGQVFPPEEIEKHRSTTFKFISKISEELLLIKFERISLSELIENKEIKNIVRKAERYRSSNRMLFVVNLKDAFDLAVLLEEQKYYRTLSPFLGLKIEYFYKDLNSILYEYDNRFRVLSLGINFREFIQYEDILDYIPQQYQIDWHGNTVLDGDFSDEQLDFVYNFVVNSIINFQNLNYIEGKGKTSSKLEKYWGKYRFEELFNNERLPDDCQKLNLTGIRYLMAGDSKTTFEAEKKYITHENYLIFKDKLKSWKIVTNEIKRWHNGVLDYHSKRSVKIIGIKFRAVRQNPGIWEYILGYEEIPNSKEIIVQKRS